MSWPTLSIFSSKIEWCFKNKFFICFLVAVCTLLIHGLLSKYYFLYNVLPYHYIANQEIYGLKNLAGFSPAPLGLLGAFTTFFAYFLQVPIPFVFASILIKAALMFGIYKIFSHWFSFPK